MLKLRVISRGGGVTNAFRFGRHDKGMLFSVKNPTLADFHAGDRLVGFRDGVLPRKPRLLGKEPYLQGKKGLIFKTVCDIQVFIKTKSGDENG